MALRKTPARAAILVVGAIAIGGVRPAHAQAWNYPAFQPPVLVAREFNFGVASAGDEGTTGIFQWREHVGPRSQFALDAGIASPSGGKNYVLLGASGGYQLLQSTADMPLDLLATFGGYAAVGSPTNIVRLPVGVSIGHRFPLEGMLAVTPFAHPRVSLDICSESRFCGDNRSKLNVNFDVGADLELSRQLSLRGAVTFGGTGYGGRDRTGFGISLAVRPQGLVRR
ncbi:MAG: hypothetical protein M3068_15190 [Gemmatimonadota bacterium]|nr:hypothetical protein [Gemmatimonadota bacterium]